MGNRMQHAIFCKHCCYCIQRVCELCLFSTEQVVLVSSPLIEECFIIIGAFSEVALRGVRMSAGRASEPFFQLRLSGVEVVLSILDKNSVIGEDCKNPTTGAALTLFKFKIFLFTRKKSVNCYKSKT